MKKILLCYYLLAISCSAFAQLQNANWVFPYKNKIKFYENGQIEINQPFFNPYNTESPNCISDKEGNLLFQFYEQNGEYGKILDKNDNIILNGDSIITSYTGFSNVLIPKPGSEKEYYLYIRGGKGTSYLKNYIMENLISIENEQPKVIYKNKILYTSDSLLYRYPFMGRLSAVQHANGKDWWVIYMDRHKGNFIKLLVSDNNTETYIQYVEELEFEYPSMYQTIGEGDFCLQGNRLAGIFVNNGIYIFTFDRCTGEIKKEIVYPSYFKLNGDLISGFPRGIAFSPSGKYLYQITVDSVFQIDILNKTRTCIYGRNVYDANGTVSIQFGQLERAINGKIYMSSYCTNVDSTIWCRSISVIHYPDKPYPSCQFEPMGLSLGDNQTGWGLPNFAVYAPPLPFAHAGWPQALCGGDSVHIGAPRQSCQYYKWKPAVGLSDTAAADPKAAPNITTTYTLTTWIDGSEQTSVDSVTVFVNPFANASITAAPDTFSGPPFTVHFKAAGADTTGLLFTWDFGDGQTGTGAITSHTYDAIDGYLVKLFVQSEDGACKDTLAYNLKLTLITGKEESKVKPFKIYPNPTDGKITVECAEKNVSIEILDPNGRVLLSEKRYILDLSGFAKGTYYIRVIRGLNEIIGVEKVILE